jgi:hypothetical protein
MDSWWFGFLIGFLVAAYVFYYRFRHGLNSSVIWVLKQLERLLNKISQGNDE